MVGRNLETNMNREHQGNSGFFNGLLVGFVLGAVVVFVLGTAKGKKLLKSITEEGWENFSELEDLLEGEIDDVYEEVPEEEIKKAKEEKKEVAKETAIPKKSSPKRFFRKITKR